MTEHNHMDVTSLKLIDAPTEERIVPQTVDLARPLGENPGERQKLQNQKFS